MKGPCRNERIFSILVLDFLTHYVGDKDLYKDKDFVYLQGSCPVTRIFFNHNNLVKSQGSWSKMVNSRNFVTRKESGKTQKQC